MESIKKLLKINLEIEGLLRILDARWAPEVEGLIKEKNQEFNELVNLYFGSSTLTPPIFIKPEKAPDAPQPEKASEVPQPEMASEVPQPETPPADSLPIVETAAKPVETEIEETVLELENKDTPMLEFYPLPAEVPVTEVPETPIAAESTPVLVNDVASRRSSRNLAKAFSINDRFRAIKCVFGNDASRFNDVVNTLSGYSNLPQAMAYLQDELDLDLENEDVKFFFSIISRHFNA